jgi:predicted dehydrogenase
MGILHSSILNLLQPKSVSAIVDKSRLISLVASKILTNTTFYNDADKALKNNPDNAFYVTTPAQSHLNVVQVLLEQGVKSIFVEKPPTVNSEQLNTLIDKSGKNQIVMAGLQKRFALPFIHAKQLLSNQVIGDIKNVDAYMRSGDILVVSSRFNSLGRGATLDLGIHLLDLLVWIFNAKTVESARSLSIYSGVDDFFEAKLISDAPVAFNVEVSWSNQDYRMPETYIEATGTSGKLRVTEDYLSVSAESPNRLLNDQKELTLYKPHYYQKAPIVNLADPEYTLEDIHFLNCIASGCQPTTAFRNLTQLMNLVDAMYAKAGTPQPHTGAT